MRKQLSQVYALSILVLAGVAHSQVEHTKLVAPDPGATDNFGQSLAIDGDIAIIGGERADGIVADSGAAYIFARDGGGVDSWGLITKVFASDGTSGDQFGVSVSVSGDFAIVGAPIDDPNGTRSGSAYILARNQGGAGNWGQVTKLTPSDAAADDFFGIRVAIDGDLAVVAADQQEDGFGGGPFGPGAVYVFSRDQGGAGNWGQVAKLVASDGQLGDIFGISVSVSGDVVLVGAHRNDDNGVDAGAAYVFQRDEGGSGNWGQVAKLLAADGASTDLFGGSVALYGDIAVVGATRNDENGSNSGAAYLFARNDGGPDNWGQIAKLLASDGVGDDEFGSSVATDGRIAVVGAFASSDDGFRSGSAYVFARRPCGPGNWTEVAKLRASDAQSSDQFGVATALDEGAILIGSYRDDDTFADAGSAYVFYGLNASPCAGDLDCDGDTDVFDFAIFGPDFGCGTE